MTVHESLRDGRKIYNTIKKDGDRLIFSKDFPNCKGLYPDCPSNPSLTEKNCRTCPKTDELKKPKMES
ncbi:MAG: hypothetical protein NTZ73_01530 [Candidatus Diapherotrites archaeon]|nr:hypothetical protein [Candidatus Diapherotrites archaeon]